MRRTLLVNASLLFMALLLASQVWISLEQQDEDQVIYLTSLSPDQVTRMEIANGGNPSIRLERTATGWMMTEPSSGKADDALIRKILEIANTRSTSRFQAPDNLVDFGLDPPLTTLTINQTRIELGALHPMNQRRYVRIGNSIHLINDRFFHLLQAPPENYTATPGQ